MEDDAATASSTWLSRRMFLQSVSALAVAGCSSSDTPPASPPSTTAPGFACEELAGARVLGRVRFLDDGEQQLDTSVGDGLDGRLYTDLAKLTPDALVIPNERFYVRTKKPDRIDYTSPWKIHVSGLVAREADLALLDLQPLAKPQGPTLLECSGNARGGSFGLMSVARWTGIPLAEVLAGIEAKPGAGGGATATRVLVSGFDEHSRPSERSVPGASWIFTRDEIAAAGAFLAVEMNGVALPEDHGFPVRLVMPGWYGCTCIKWVNEIRLVGDDEPSTEHMREFASRTHQDGTPSLARDFRPAAIDLAAMPIRIDRVQMGGTGGVERLLITGIHWGGDRTTADLDLIVTGRPSTRARICAARESALTWGLWSAAIDMPPPGTYEVTLRSVDRNVRTRRLDSAFYARSFVL